MQRFSVNYTFHGRATDIIEAESLDAARAAIEEKLDDENFHIEADDIDDVDYQVQQMHPVTRDGREIWTTYIMGHDLRGHPSAILDTPLFAANDDNKEAALGAVA